MKNELSRTKSQHNTKQRALIQDILRNSKGHLDTDEIYQQARSISPGISLSTVYRNLKMFRKQGLVEQYQFGNRNFYEASQTRHYHLICLGCGRIFEFDCPAKEDIKAKIFKEAGFTVTEADVRITGYCPDCQKQSLTKKNNNIKRRIKKGGK